MAHQTERKVHADKKKSKTSIWLEVQKKTYNLTWKLIHSVIALAASGSRDKTKLPSRYNNQ